MLWLKALHLIFVVCWFAGLFYLPRIFVYYAASEHDETRQHLAIMSRKLYRFVTPLMALAIIFGLAMIAMQWQYYLQARWMWLKLLAVLFLFVYHLQCGRYVRRINEHSDDHGHIFYRFFNEVPVLFLFLIVILVVLKPF